MSQFAVVGRNMIPLLDLTSTRHNSQHRKLSATVQHTFVRATCWSWWPRRWHSWSARFSCSHFTDNGH